MITASTPTHYAQRETKVPPDRYRAVGAAADRLVFSLVVPRALGAWDFEGNHAMRAIYYVSGPQAGSTVMVEDQDAVHAIASGEAVANDSGVFGELSAAPPPPNAAAASTPAAPAAKPPGTLRIKASMPTATGA